MIFWDGTDVTSALATGDGYKRRGTRDKRAGRRIPQVDVLILVIVVLILLAVTGHLRL